MPPTAREFLMTNTDEPLWRQIAETLRDEINTGAYQSGDKLPSEARLADRFGVNRHTVRRSLADLAEAGLVISRRGAGVFVAAQPADYPLTRHMRFHRNLEATGRVPGRRVLRLERLMANRDEAEALDLSEGDPVFVLEGLTLVDGVTVGHFRSVFPALRLEGFEEACKSGLGVTASLEACGVVNHRRAWTRLTAVNADAILAGHMKLRKGAAVMQSHSLNVSQEGQPVELGLAHFAGDRVTLTVTPD